jgi:hypothetical protein
MPRSIRAAAVSIHLIDVRARHQRQGLLIVAPIAVRLLPGADLRATIAIADMHRRLGRNARGRA